MRRDTGWMMSVLVPAVLPARLARALGDPMEGALNTSIVSECWFITRCRKKIRSSTRALQQPLDILPTILPGTRSMLDGDVLDEHKVIGTVTEIEDLSQRLLLQHARSCDVTDAVHTQAPWKQEPVRDEPSYVGRDAGVCLLRNEDA